MKEKDTHLNTYSAADKNQKTESETESSLFLNSGYPQRVDEARAVIELLEKSSLTEIEYRSGDFSIRAVKGHAHGNSHPNGAHPWPAYPTTSMIAGSDSPIPAVQSGTVPMLSSENMIKSPMVGTAYLSPKPGDPPFVSLDAVVQEGQTVLIIEAMKTMNTIKAGKSGRVKAILVKNGDPVEFGQSLIHIE